MQEVRFSASPPCRIRRRALHIGSDRLTSKMSEADDWRGACESTIRDKHPASLHRIVRLCFHSDLSFDIALTIRLWKRNQ